ncbi:thyrostimulin alpha-2 subunit-like [Liolophura sinensis]|uniref:thyrostimulin alpha-2 subunit-like n=1 Tax=Liolophura sinensis TaxID=3198878 RepID=UPI003158A3E1
MDLRHVIVVTYKLFLILLFCSHSLAIHSWERPGCHILAHTRTVEVDGCLAFNVTTNACRGFCESNAIPSPERTLRANHYHIITSRAECCSIVDTHDVKYTVLCVDGRREFVFKSAKTCACSICRRG